ncbi:unnamed protein product [Linum tenue]|uniref:GDT1 family protein n=1 Tax=Linum tenue TaxID=586396 RepID=A0AAV0MD41_9ROSI|nr:unnamed protein product [Linum tenue]
MAISKPYQRNFPTTDTESERPNHHLLQGKRTQQRNGEKLAAGEEGVGESERMRSVAVSEGRFISPHCSLPPSPCLLNGKPLKSRLLPLSPMNTTPSSSSRLLSRCSRKGLTEPFQEVLRGMLPGVYDNDSHDSGVGDGANNSRAPGELVRIMDGNGKINSFQEIGAVEAATLHEGVMKLFVFLSGCLVLQGSDPAAAVAMELSNSGLQSIPYLGDLGDIRTGFASAFLLIFFSELGDKTFFIAALLAARNSAAIVFTGTFGALGVMTVISVLLGRTFHYVDEILPFSVGGTDLPIDDIAAVCLLVSVNIPECLYLKVPFLWNCVLVIEVNNTFPANLSIFQVYFGISTLIDASSSDSPKAEDEQKEAELAVSEFSGNGAGILSAANTIVSTFALVFVAEWGDKSFFSTIALAAASSPLGVIAGALAGHGVATLIAVLGGSLLGTFLSEKVIAYIGGILFLVFAAMTLIEIVS